MEKHLMAQQIVQSFLTNPRYFYDSSSKRKTVKWPENRNFAEKGDPVEVLMPNGKFEIKPYEPKKMKQIED